MKKIGILGSGIVSKTLGKGFIEYGYDVMLGTRDVLKLEKWRIDNGKNATIGTFEECVKFGDIVVLAVKGSVAQELIKNLKHLLKGKTVIDTTNPIAADPPVNGVLKYFTSPNNSLMEILQNEAPDAHFVKAFNSIGSTFMVNPKFDSKPSMFICGNNKIAKSEVKEILDQFGWETEDMGMSEGARAIEPLCMLWCIPGMINNEWSHAFKLLKL